MSRVGHQLLDAACTFSARSSSVRCGPNSRARGSPHGVRAAGRAGPRCPGGSEQGVRPWWFDGSTDQGAERPSRRLVSLPFGGRARAWSVVPPGCGSAVSPPAAGGVPSGFTLSATSRPRSANRRTMDAVAFAFSLPRPPEQEHAPCTNNSTCGPSTSSSPREPSREPRRPSLPPHDHPRGPETAGRRNTPRQRGGRVRWRGQTEPRPAPDTTTQVAPTANFACRNCCWPR